MPRCTHHPEKCLAKWRARTHRRPNPLVEMGGLEDWVRKAVAELLERLLGKFVKGINENSLRLNALEGDLTLENLALRHEAFEALNLPLAIADGQLAAIRVKVPWRNLHEERVIIEMHDVVLILTPKDISNAATAKEEELAIAAKRAALEAWEAVQEKEEGLLSNFVGEQVEKLVRSLLQRLEVEVRNVHVRVQHGHELAAGMVIRSVRVADLPAPPVGGSRLGKQTFEAMLAAIVRKSVKVDGVGIYLTPPGRVEDDNREDVLATKPVPEIAPVDFVLAPAALSLAIEYDPASARGGGGDDRGAHRYWPQLKIEANIDADLTLALRHSQLSGELSVNSLPDTDACTSATLTAVHTRCPLPSVLTIMSDRFCLCAQRCCQWLRPSRATSDATSFSAVAVPQSLRTARLSIR